MTPWVAELDQPTDAFFRAFAARISAPEGVHGAVREAILHLVPRIDWEGYLPQMPHGLLGLAAVMALRPCVEERTFLRMLATQLHAFGTEGRAAEGRSLSKVGLGSGHWPAIELAVREHHPSLAWGELAAVKNPQSEDFRRLLSWVAPDMANIGHKAAGISAAEKLWQTLEGADLGRLLLAWSGWLAAAPPEDRFWHLRMARRIEGVQVPCGHAVLSVEWHRDFAREICDLGLVALLDAVAVRLKGEARSGDLLAGLVLAASEKMVDARRDLEGKTAWNLVYLAALNRHLAALEQPAVWGQAAALVNFFPSDAPEDRYRIAHEPSDQNPSTALLEAILDGEAERALNLAAAGQPDETILPVLAEAASRNDPGLNQSSQALAVAAAADLAPSLPSQVVMMMYAALAKSLANSQGSDELGRKAERGMGQLPI